MQVHTGHDDATLAMLQDELDMIKIGKDPAKVPLWLRANKPMIPDFVAKDPKVLAQTWFDSQLKTAVSISSLTYFRNSQCGK